LGGSVHKIKESAEVLLVANKEIGLEVNAEKTKYTVMSRDQTAGRSHSMKIKNSSFERVEWLKYMGRILTNQNSIQEEIKSRLKLLSFGAESFVFRLLSKNLKINIYRIIILPVFVWV
jgi:hypothetical protein